MIAPKRAKQASTKRTRSWGEPLYSRPDPLKRQKVMGDENERSKGIREDVNRTSVEFLLIDSALAGTFLTIAERTGDRLIADRNILNARKAYDTIQHLRGGYVLTQMQADTLNETLLDVRTRLVALGQTFAITP